MGFCKRCHKRVIEEITTTKEFLNACGCGICSGVRLDSEAMTNVCDGLIFRRTGDKRRVAKQLSSCYVPVTHPE